MDGNKVAARAEMYPIPENTVFTYGTAGFRMRAELLDPVLFRVGVVAAFRSLFLNGQTVGVMITASHNPSHDNGVKIVDPTGDMLPGDWESVATNLCNADATNLPNVMSKLTTVLQITDSTKVTPSVAFGYDTRPSSVHLATILQDALASCGAKQTNLGLVTTPQLHYIVRCIYNNDYGEPSLTGYYKKYAKAFVDALNGAKPPNGLVIDCANGVGTQSVKELKSEIESLLGRAWDISIVNTAVDDQSLLNFEAGADFVKTHQDAPPSLRPLDARQHYCSLDGDADRVVFYYGDDAGRFFLLDGDKIASLIAFYVASLINTIGGSLKSDLILGVVQTAYANGSSSKYLQEELQIPVKCAATGVKNLHHVAQTMDIGIYFEANGHGTVLFSEKAQSLIREQANASPENAQLLATMDLINQTVGDAVSDMLLVEMILSVTKTSVLDWNSRYTELPNKLAKVFVNDRTAFKTVNEERQLAAPHGLQQAIDDAVSEVPQGRSFVRPSGTEDCVRVYAEAETAEGVAKLIANVSELVKKY